MFNLLDVFNKPVKAKALVSAVYYSLDDRSKTTDIKKRAILVKEKGTIAIDTTI